MKLWHWVGIGIGAGICAGIVAYVGVPVIGHGTWEQTGRHMSQQTGRSGFGAESESESTPPSPHASTDLAPAFSPDLLESAFSAKAIWSVRPDTRILFVPHHLVAAKEIASLFSSAPTPKRVILLTPDHLGVGRGAVTIGETAIVAGGETIEVDGQAAGEIASQVSGSVLDTSSVSSELAMQALLPFVERAWPRASMIPIIVRMRTEPRGSDLREELASAIVRLIAADPDTVLVASVDFSHYLPAEVADFHDELAMDVVSSLADREADRVELDSPDVLAVALKAARELGLGGVTIHAHTNSLRILQSKLSFESTSHIIASFANGPIKDQETTTVLFLGDIMLDREVRARISRSKAADYPFSTIQGQEGRFFEGQDLVVANLEGPVTKTLRSPEKTIDFAFDPSVVPLLKNIGIDAVSQATNHTLDQGRAGADDSRALLAKGGIAVFGDQVKDEAAYSMTIMDVRGRSESGERATGKKVALLGFNDSDRPVDREKAGAAIAEAKGKADRVIVMVHWGNEYQAKPNARQSSLAHWFVDEGADAVIGGHPHWMQSVEVYQDRVIAYSLGNFVFDQDWSVETREGLAAGLVLDQDETKLYLYPIHIEKSEPKLLTGDARKARLERLASISDPALREEITGGMITISR